jgi:hypothetical protein
VKDRLLIPEILDSLPPNDPRAVRSRRDLVFINAMMGNYRWIARRVLLARGCNNWIELGAGDGPLAVALPDRSTGSVQITGMDLAPRPLRWPTNWDWIQGDLSETLPLAREGVFSQRPATKEYEECRREQSAVHHRGLVANLFLHHFDGEELSRIGAFVNESFSRLVLVEPARYRAFRILGFLLFPFVNDVTRHDLQISIGAGFRKGELSKALQLDQSWQIAESTTVFGAHRFEAWRK